MGKRIEKDNRGTALFVAIVVCAIVCVFSLALLSLSYSVFVGEAEKKTSLAGQEMSKMASRLIEKELSSGTDESILSYYIKEGITAGTWECGEKLPFMLGADSSKEQLNQLAASIHVYFIWEETGESLPNDTEETMESAPIESEETMESVPIETEETGEDETDEKNPDETVEKILEQADVNIGDTVETTESAQLETSEETKEDLTGKKLHVYILYEDGEQQYVWEDIYFLSIEGGKWVWYPEKRGVPANENE